MRLFLLSLLLVLSQSVSSQTNFSFTRIPYSATDLKRPNAGMEYWIYQNQVTVPLSSSPANNETGRYDRWEWRAFEQTQGVYNWALFDASINEAINRGQKFSFGIMASCGGCSDFQVSVSGSTNKTLPNYVINNGGAFVYGGVWYPNWNSTVYKSAWQAFQNALAAHINSTSYNGVPYSRVINYIDLRGVGEYDEWHFCGFCPDYGSSLMYVADNGGYKPTVASYKFLIDVFTTAFANYRLVAMSDGFDPGGWSETPDEVINYLITRTTNKGNVGWRRDNWGHNRPTWYENKFESNPSVWNGQAAQPIIMNRWQTAPVVGEPYQGESQVNGQSRPYQILTESVNGAPAQTQFYHLSNLGNGNMERTGEAGTQTSVREAHKRMGYRYYVSAGSMTTTVTSGGTFNISLTWGNEGVAPTYDRWYIRYTLRNSTTNAVVWTGNSTYNLKNLLPDATYVDAQNFTASGVPEGTYRLHLAVVDSSGYMPNMPLFINGVQSDASYILRSGIFISGGGAPPPNTPPTANAGSDVSITLPNNSFNLTGSGSDVDGGIASYAWTKVSGPTGGAISSPSSATTSITGMVEGVYTYRLTVTDDDGATGTDDVQITVLAVVDTNNPPVANAGPDQEITLPTNTVTLAGSGTDNDGRIVQLQWVKVSGPSGGTISSPGSGDPFTSNMVAGTYVYRLTVTDDDGATDSDEMQVVVNPEPINPEPGNWIFNTTPNPIEGSDGQGISLGVKFRANQNGAITRMRFWKTTNNTGTHTAAIWDAEGNILATGTFSGESATGWQYVTLSDTVWVVADVLYVAAYFTPTGNYAKNEGGLDETVSGTYLSAPSSGSVGGNGVYSYSGSLEFPTNTYNGNNYWVDVEYVDASPAEPPANIPPTVDCGTDISLRLPATSTQLVATATDVDGSVTTYLWQQISGPVTATFSNTGVYNPTVSDMFDEGVYTFLVTVTDDDGAEDTDIVVVTVDGARLNWGRRKTFMYKGRSIRFRR